MAKGTHSYNSGRIHRAGQPAEAAPQEPGGASRPPASSKRKKRRWPYVVVSALLLIALALGGALWWAWRYVDDALDPGVMGSMTSVVVDHGGSVVEMPPEPYSKSDVVHILLLGIDYEEGREYPDGMGLTDMVMYMRYDIKNNKMSLLQVPRDSYIGDEYAGDGKINSLLLNGPDKENPINNVVVPFQAMFKLPVDYYLTIDMESLERLVDTLGGLRVYVPKPMSWRGVSLEPGWQWLSGGFVEFFVRTRYGPGFERADVDRLDNQRYFYSALFRRFLNMTPGDIVNLLPIIKVYCNTNLEVSDIIGIGLAGLNLKAEDVLFCKAPGATGAGLDPWGPNAEGKERSLYIIDLYGRGELTDEAGGLGENPGLALMLNTYFRSEGVTVPAGELLLPQAQIPAGYALYPPNIQGMSEVQEDEGGADVNVEPGWDASGSFIGDQ